MNILMLSPFIPWPLDQGGKIRVYNVLKGLSRRHNVTLVCIAPVAADFGPLTKMCDEVIVLERGARPVRDLARLMLGGDAFNCARFDSRLIRMKLQELAARRKYDLVQIEFSLLWPHARHFDGIPVVLDAHNIEHFNVQEIGNGCSSRAKRLLYRLEEERLRDLEEAAWSECALCFAVSEKEREEIAARAGDDGKVVTAANGVDPERFAFRPRSGAGRSILFLGGMDYAPNLDAARHFLGEIFPLVRSEEPEARVLLVGRELKKIGAAAAQPGVECHESVPEVLPFFYQADVLAVPLRQGAGTRIKVLEAMAAGLPIVSTPKGCEGIPVKSGEHLLVAEEPAAFAAAVVSTMRDGNIKKTVAEKARNLVETRYSWQSVANVMIESYGGLGR